MLVLIITLNRTSLVNMEVVGCSLKIMMIFVVWSIFNFVSYYIGMDVSEGNFKLVIIMFLALIVLMLKSFRILMFLR